MSKPRPCRRCRGTTTVMRDGKLFCATCSEQIEEFFEVDDDEDLAMGAAMSQFLKTPKAKPTREGAVVEEEGLATQAPKTRNKKRKPAAITPENPTLPDTYTEELNDSARHSKECNIGATSSRIGSFAKVLRKLSSMMVVELGFPEHYQKHVHGIAQLYLQSCGVAFVEDEYTEDADQMFKKAVIIKKSKNAIAENLKRLKLEKKKKGKEELEQTKDAWEFLQETRMTENFELSSEDDEANQTRREEAYSQSQLEVIETNVGKSVKERAEQMYLNMDIVVAVLYLASVSSGCVWVTISDIVRWIREDRGKIFGEMVQLTLQGEKTSGGRGYTNEVNYINSLSMPLYEFYRTCSWLHQFVAIETSLVSPGYSQLVARYLYNLNLPTDMMERVLILMDCAPLAEFFDNGFLTQQGDISEGRFNPCISQKLVQRQDWFGRGNKDVFITIETKILAYILLALKLVYGLDDQREYETRPNSFDPIEWLYQLKMRTLMWEGHAVNDVLNQTKINYPLANLKCANLKLHKFINTGFSLNVNSRVGVFETLLPSITVCETAFHQENPHSADVTDRNSGRNDEDRIYAPARAQSTIAKNFMAEKRSEEFNWKLEQQISVDSYQILTKDYGDQRVRVSKNAKPVEELYGSETSSKERCASEENRSKWKKLFPCASGYVKYPQPIWARQMVIYKKETNREYHKLNRRIVDQRQSLVGPREIFLSSVGISDLYETAKLNFSSNFADLLDLFSKCISEHYHVLYAAMIMLETQIVDRAEYKDICEKIIEGVTFPLPYMMKRKEQNERFSEYGDVRVSVDGNISKPNELRRLRFGIPKDWGMDIFEDNPSDSEFGNSSESESDDEYYPELSSNESTEEEDEEYSTREVSYEPEEKEKVSKERKKDSVMMISKLYGWEVLWRLITMRVW